MRPALFPTRLADSAWDIPYEELYARGIRGLIFDIDNTLAPHGAPDDGRAEALFSYLRAAGFRTCLLSNNREERVAPFAGRVESAYVCRAGKPAGRGYRQAMEKMGTQTSSTVLIGDQIFTDIYGAGRLGMERILVKPICPREEIQIVLKRIPERLVLWLYRRYSRRAEAGRPGGESRRERRICRGGKK